MRETKNKTIKQNEIAVQLSKVTKQYVLHHEKPTFSEKLISHQKKEIYTALSKINLTIHKGEKVGVIGPNGAGKTTLLKIISGITTPNFGKIMTNGKLVSLIDLEAGFHPDLSGIENIFLNGLVIGMNKVEILKKLDEIIDFADIGQFIDAPLYTYSQGMKLRLGFSIAVHANPEILVLDENLSVGDENFRKKSQLKINEFFLRNKTVIIASHVIDFLSENCTRIIWLNNNKLFKDGQVKKLLDQYTKKAS